MKKAFQWKHRGRGLEVKFSEPTTHFTETDTPLFPLELIQPPMAGKAKFQPLYF
jgi:hypothetical protein